MPESTSGEPVGFHPHRPSNHLVHLSGDDANELIDYVLWQSQPAAHPGAATLRGVAALGAAAALAVLVLLSFHRTDASVVVLGAAVAGWLVRYAVVEFTSARHGRANDHITEIIAAYERRAINRDGQR